MEQEPESGEDSHAQAESATEEETPLPDTISDEYYSEICTRANELIQTLQSEQQFVWADEFQRIFVVCQGLRKLLLEEQHKNEDLQLDMLRCQERIAEVMKLSEEDQEKIGQLREEIESSWSQTDAAQAREQEAQKQMYVMLDKFEQLQKEAEKYTDSKDGQEMGTSMAKHKEGILRERDRLSTEVEDLSIKLQLQKTYAEELEKKITDFESKNKDLYKLLDETSSEAFKEKRLLENLRTELQDVAAERDLYAEEAKTFKTKYNVIHKTTLQHNLQMAAIKSNVERLSTQNTVQSMKIAKLSGEYDNIVHVRDKLSHDLNVKGNILKLKEDENNKFRVETAKLVKSKELLMRKMMTAGVSKVIWEQEGLKLKNIIANLEKEYELLKKTHDKTKSQIDNLTRERDLVRKDLIKANRIIGELNEKILLHDQETKTLKQEIKSHQSVILKNKEAIRKAEKDRDKNAEELLVWVAKEERFREEIQKKINQITELKGKISDYENKVFHVQQLYEAARTERSSLQKEVQVCAEEREELKKRLRTVTKQAEQAKEELTQREADQAKVHKNLDRAEKEKVALKAEIHGTLTGLQHIKSEMKEKQMEIERMRKTVEDCDASVLRLQKQLDSTVSEKDLVGGQLIERTEEVALVSEKLQDLQLALDRSETQYARRLDDIRLLKVEISGLRSQVKLLSRGLANTTDMQQEVLQLHRVLSQERVKAKALEDEMTTPMNVHRWRELGGRDPDKMELIDKIQALQRRVLRQTIDATHRENALQEAHQETYKLRKVLLKLPSHRIKERLNSTQRALMLRTRELKAVVAELKVKDLDIKSHSSNLEEIKHSLVEARKEATKQKKEKLRLLETQRLVQQIQMMPSTVSCNRSMGAGYKIV
ncbi:cilia- and flagella-associated protein 58-like [Phlebotomus argentipes]|uniref:cilia- and flagella-associated protein 58-like n=1 Tax=Phlebotomus argentipes TaxID=94469 RepID=UPI002892CFC3|nr:cilia- and flagella-associated protein 58-like [Phlebotomus argentipes]